GGLDCLTRLPRGVARDEEYREHDQQRDEQGTHGVRPTIVALDGLRLGWRRGGPGGGPARGDGRAAPVGMGAPEGVPAPGALHRPQTGHRLRPRVTPAPPGPFLPRRDQRLVRTLDHAGANRELAGYKARVVHPRRVLGEVLLRFADLLRR